MQYTHIQADRKTEKERTELLAKLKLCSTQMISNRIETERIDSNRFFSLLHHHHHSYHNEQTTKKRDEKLDVMANLLENMEWVGRDWLQKWKQYVDFNRPDDAFVSLCESIRLYRFVCVACAVYARASVFAVYLNFVCTFSYFDYIYHVVGFYKLLVHHNAKNLIWFRLEFMWNANSKWKRRRR